MNKKILALAFMLLAIPILSAIPVFAGKGTTMQDFVFRINGASVPASADRVVLSPPPPKDLINMHVFGQEYAGEFSIEIGASGSTETIMNDCIEYDCELTYQYHVAKLTISGVVVRETISIYDEGEEHTPAYLRGTLVILATGQGKQSFIGFGTDEFEGVQVKGFTEQVVPNQVMNRIGTVMGWP